MRKSEVYPRGVRTQIVAAAFSFACATSLAEFGLDARRAMDGLDLVGGAISPCPLTAPNRVKGNLGQMTLG